MASVGDTLPHCTGSGIQADPYIYTTAEGLLEAIDVVNAYVEAGSENLVFDANDGVITTLKFKCTSIDAKGTTVRNLISYNQSKVLIEPYCLCNVTIRNFNAYNMVIISNSSSQRPRLIGVNEEWVDGSSGRSQNFYNCNFTAICRGNVTSDYSHRGFIKSKSYNDANRGYLRFYNCTFNLNFDVVTNTTVHFSIFYSDDGGFDDATLNNCTICLSGTIRQDKAYGYNLYVLDTFKAINCVFTNSVNNPLILPLSSLLTFAMKETNYNYIKLYINGNSSAPYRISMSNGTKTLWNKSRCTNYDTTNMPSCITMQEDDSSQTDYIYDAENLANAGFIVGQVIE